MQYASRIRTALLTGIAALLISGIAIVPQDHSYEEPTQPDSSRDLALERARRDYRTPTATPDAFEEEIRRLKTLPTETATPNITYSPPSVTYSPARAPDYAGYVTQYNCVPEGWCSGTASGELVSEGTAACDPSRMGQSFTIVGDPTSREYRCNNTGGLVWDNHVDVFFYEGAAGDAWLGELSQFYAQNYPDIAAFGTYGIIEWK